MIPKHQPMKRLNNGTVLSLLNTHTKSAGWIKSMCVPVLQTLLGRVGYWAQQSCNPARGEETLEHSKIFTAWQKYRSLPNFLFCEEVRQTLNFLARGKKGRPGLRKQRHLSTWAGTLQSSCEAWWREHWGCCARSVHGCFVVTEVQ